MRAERCRAICWNIHRSKKTDVALITTALVSGIVAILGRTHVLKMKQSGMVAGFAISGAIVIYEPVRLYWHSQRPTISPEREREPDRVVELPWRKIAGKSCNHKMLTACEDPHASLSKGDIVAQKNNDDSWTFATVSKVYNDGTLLLSSGPKSASIRRRDALKTYSQEDLLDWLTSPISLIGLPWDSSEFPISDDEENIHPQKGDIVAFVGDNPFVFGEIIEVNPCQIKTAEDNIRTIARRDIVAFHQGSLALLHLGNKELS